MLFKTLMYKTFVKRYFAVICSVLCVGAFLFAFAGINSTRLKNPADRNMYNELIDSYSGKLTEEKNIQLENLSQKKNEVYEKTEALNKSFADGEISVDEYKEKRNELNRSLDGQDGYSRFLQRVAFAENNDAEIYDDIPWNVLFNDGITELAGCFAVIYLAVVLFIYDIGKPVSALFCSTKYGKRRLYKTDILIMISSSFILGALLRCIKFLTVLIFYGIKNSTVPLMQYENFSGCDSSLSFVGGYIYLSLLICFGYVFTGGFVFLAGVLLKNSLYCVGVSVISVILPVVFEGNRLLLFCPLPFNMIFPSGLFTVIDDGINAAFTSEQRFFTVMLSVIVCFVCYLTAYLKITRRNAL